MSPLIDEGPLSQWGLTIPALAISLAFMSCARAPSPPPTLAMPQATPTRLEATPKVTLPAHPSPPTSTSTATCIPSAPREVAGSLPIAPGLTIDSQNASRLTPFASLSIEGGQLTWSPDGTRLAVGTRANVLVFSPFIDAIPRTYALSEDWDNPLPQFGPVAFSPDGRHLAGGFTVVVAVWGTVTGDLEAEYHSVSGEVTSVAYSPDGLWIAGSGSRGGFVSRTSTTATSFWIDTSPDPTWSVAFSTDSMLLASSGPISIMIWDPSSAIMLREVPGTAFQLAFSPSGSILAAGLDLWDPSTGTLLRRLEVDPTLHQISLAFHPSGDILALGFDDGSIRFFNPKSGALVSTLFAAHSGRVRGVAFSPDGRLLASTGSDDILHLWAVPDQ